MNLTGARALTLLNPWAHLIAHYGKNVENRTWMPHAGVDRLYIHAGKGWEDSELGDMWQDTAEAITTSAIVAVADLAFACNTSRDVPVLACGCDPNWAMPGHCHWNLTNILALPEPVPCRGAQGLWTPAPVIVEAVAAQLTAVAS